MHFAKNSYKRKDLKGQRQTNENIGKRDDSLLSELIVNQSFLE
jgi:hypothetical protein